jgi:hypothetical protein
MARDPQVVHLCGAGCAMKETERWMTSIFEASRSGDNRTVPLQKRAFR